MNHKPLVLSDRVLYRMLMSFAQHLGVTPLYADAMAQVYLQTNKTMVASWDAFFRSQCAHCDESAETCTFFDIPKDKRPVGRNLAEIQSAYETSIETGRLTVCPVRLSKNPA